MAPQELQARLYPYHGPLKHELLMSLPQQQDLVPESSFLNGTQVAGQLVRHH